MDYVELTPEMARHVGRIEGSHVHHRRSPDEDFDNMLCNSLKDSTRCKDDEFEEAIYEEISKNKKAYEYDVSDISEDYVKKVNRKLGFLGTKPAKTKGEKTKNVKAIKTKPKKAAIKWRPMKHDVFLF